MSRQRKNIRRKKVNLFSRSNLHQFCGFQFIALPAYGLNAGGGGGGSLKNHLHCCVLKSNFFSHNAKRGTWPPKKRMNERTFSAEREGLNQTKSLCFKCVEDLMRTQGTSARVVPLTAWGKTHAQQQKLVKKSQAHV